MLESTLTKMLVDVGRESLAWLWMTEWNTEAAGFRLRTEASVSRALEPEMSPLSGLQMHSVIDLLLSACSIDVGLVLQSDRKFLEMLTGTKNVLF